MTIDKHVKTFAGRPVARYRRRADPPTDPAAVAWRVAGSAEKPDDFTRRLEAFLGTTWAGEVRSLVIGHWGDGPSPVRALIKAADRLRHLTALFVGDVTAEENEISWIQLDKVAALIEAYPALEVLRLRGSGGLRRPVRHEALRELAFESGGLPARAVRSVGESTLPQLRHLELWLGTDEYGGDADVDDLAPILAGGGWPHLEYLGLRNAEIADLLAPALASAPVVARLSTLDLSMGMLSDVGAAALLAGQPLTHLKRLNLRHHFLSKEMARRLREEFASSGSRVELGQALGGGNAEDRYIAVSE